MMEASIPKGGNAVLDTVYIHWISRYDYEPGWQLDPHSHSYYQIIHIVDGFGTFYIGECEIRIKPKLTFIIPPNERHGLNAPDDSRVKTLDVKFDLKHEGLCERINELGDDLAIECAEARARLETIRAESLTKAKYYKEAGSLELMRLIYSLLRIADEHRKGLADAPAVQPHTAHAAHVAHNHEEPLAEQLKAYVRKNYSKPLGLNSISAALGYNKSYICHAFKKSCGITPMQFLCEYRIEQAKELIRDTDNDLKHIAAMTGFCNIQHFTRMFTGISGMTPGSFRERERLGIRRDVFVDERFHNAVYTRKKPNA